MKMDQRPWVLRIEFLKAIEEKNVNMVNSILDSGFDLDINLTICKNAISICALNGWYEMAQLLIRRGCSLSLKNSMGQQPLTLAVLGSNYWLVKLLLDNRADRTCLDIEGKSALHYACELNRLRIMELLTENASPQLINLRGHNFQTPLMYACKHGGVALVDHLISKGADVNASDCFHYTPLFAALKNIQCTPEMVESLLNAGANINHISSTSETVLLCALRTSIGCMGKTKYQSDTQFQKICLLLIDRGCDVNAQNFQKETALHLAVQLGDETIVRKLLNAGCMVDTENKLDLAPLFYACQSAAPALVALLMRGGADTDRIHDNTLALWTWYTNGLHLKGDNNYALVLQILQQSKKCCQLSEVCRRTLRKMLHPDVEKKALQLPLPRSLLNFILLAD